VLERKAGSLKGEMPHSYDSGNVLEEYAASMELAARVDIACRGCHYVTYAHGPSVWKMGCHIGSSSLTVTVRCQLGVALALTRVNICVVLPLPRVAFGERNGFLFLGVILPLGRTGNALLSDEGHI
jgi:hypothetical protein